MSRHLVLQIGVTIGLQSQKLTSWAPAHLGKTLLEKTQGPCMTAYHLDIYAFGARGIDRMVRPE